MPRKRSPLLVQVLLFLLVTLLGVATGTLTKSTGALPWGLEFLRQQSLPLAGGTVLLIIGVMVWRQHRVDQRPALPARPVWDSVPFPGLEEFAEQDSAMFFGRDVEIADLLERRHPVVAEQAHRLITLSGETERDDFPSLLDGALDAAVVNLAASIIASRCALSAPDRGSIWCIS